MELNSLGSYQLLTNLQQSGRQIWTNHLPRCNSINNCRMAHVCRVSRHRSLMSSSTLCDIPRQNTRSLTHTLEQHTRELWQRVNWPNLSRRRSMFRLIMVERVDLFYLENNRLVHTDVVTSYLRRKHPTHILIQQSYYSLATAQQVVCVAYFTKFFPISASHLSCGIKYRSRIPRPLYSFAILQDGAPKKIRFHGHNGTIIKYPNIIKIKN